MLVPALTRWIPFSSSAPESNCKVPLEVTVPGPDKEPSLTSREPVIAALALMVAVPFTADSVPIEMADGTVTLPPKRLTPWSTDGWSPETKIKVPEDTATEACDEY